jgi:hypothetical protein
MSSPEMNPMNLDESSSEIYTIEQDIGNTYPTQINIDSDDSEKLLPTGESQITIPFYEKLCEEDQEDLNDYHRSNYILMYYLNSEVLKMANGDFHKIMVEDITHIIFQTFQRYRNDYRS